MRSQRGITEPADHVGKLIHDELVKRLVAGDFPVFAEFTYGKRINKAPKGTETATDLLQTHSGRAVGYR
jgi:hypothetical protein